MEGKKEDGRCVLPACDIEHRALAAVHFLQRGDNEDRSKMGSRR